MELSVKLKLLTQHKQLANILQTNLGYLGDELFSFQAESSNDSADNTCGKSFSKKIALTKSKKLIIVARKYYQEQWKTYSALTMKELKNILTLQQQVNKGLKLIQRVVINKEQDGLDVKTITFDSDLVATLSKHVILIPETELLRRHVTNGGRTVAEIDSPCGVLFWSHSVNKVNSVYKKGFVNNLVSFKQSVGLPNDTDDLSISEQDYATLLFQLIENTPVQQLFAVASVNINPHELINLNKLHALYLAPLVLTGCFLLSVNSYFYVQKNILSAQLEESNAEVMALLNDKQIIDKTNQTINIINTEFLSVQATHEVWNILHKAIESGMQVSRFKRDKQGVELRGLAEQSTKILSDLNELPEVTDATFKGGIRKSRGKDSFTIVLQVKSPRSESTKGVNSEI